MEFWVKLILVHAVSGNSARNDLHANCDYVCNNFWLFEGDEDALHEGIDFTVIDEQAIEGIGDMTSSEIKDMVLQAYDIEDFDPKRVTIGDRL